MKLPIEIKTKWIAALRSGEYKQAKHELHDGRGFCCLGVLAEVLEPGVTKAGGELCGMTSFRCSEEVNNGIRTFAQRHELGALFSENKGLRYEADKEEVSMGGYMEADRALMGFNDNGWTFGHIATLIEEHL
jgi:hypothetical protein